MKKVLSVVLVSIMIFCIPSFSVTALTAESQISETEILFPKLYASSADYKESESMLSQTVEIEEFKVYLLDNISKAKEIISISGYSIPSELYSAVSELIWYGMPEAFNVSGIGFTVYGSNLDEIRLVYRSFADTEAEYTSCFEEFKASADKLLDGIEGNASLAEEEKALLLHDRLCVWNAYTAGTVTDVEHTAYGAFVNRSSVCQGYAMAYMYLLDRAGIDNYYCSSDALNHAWNIVYIDETPYHVDVTWDDYAWEVGERGVAGAIKHDNFLRSTNGIVLENHVATDFDSTPSDTKYDNYYWQNSNAEFQLVGNKIYYIDNVNEKLMCTDGNTVLKKISDIWSAGGNSYWGGNFARLSSAGGELFYSLSDGVYKYTVKTGVATKIFTPSSMPSGFSVFGFTYEDGYLICDINTAPPYGDISGLYQVRQKYDDITHIMKKIEINTASLKTEYYIGDEFDFEGMSITAVYSDGKNDVFTEGFSYSGFSSDTAGEKTVTVEYGGFSSSYKVNVKTPYVKFSVTALELVEREAHPVKAETYPSGQSLIWKSSSDNASVADGIITAIKKGKATVTAEFTYNGIIYKAFCDIDILCGHFDAEEHPEIPPTEHSVGYTKGLFCGSCDKYISGRTEIPKLDMTFRDSEKAESDGTYIKMTAGSNAAELLSQAPEGSYIKAQNGSTLSSESLVGTGMILVFPNKTEQKVIVFGDVDGDGKISAADARLALRASVGLESFGTDSAQYRASNVNGDTISAADAREILRVSVGLEAPEKWKRA